MTVDPYIEKTFLAIDIGSNAMRASFAVLDRSNDLEILKTVRFPLRLGLSVFKKQKISDEKIAETVSAFKELKKDIDEMNIKNIRAFATSAIRDAKNGNELVELIKKKFNITIEVIDGQKEAKIISQAVNYRIPTENQCAMLIDIGGGSTEITLLNHHKILYSKSFQCGTLRLLQLENLEEVKSTAKALSKELYKDLEKKELINKVNLCIGTGGNLRRMGKLRKIFFKRSYLKIFQSELIAINDEVQKFSIEQRMNFLNMRRDRADVIVPAMTIIEEILIKFDLTEILLPQVGLKEGIFLGELKKMPRNIYNF